MRKKPRSISATELAAFFVGRSTADQKNAKDPPAAVRRLGEAEHARHDADVKRFARRRR